MKYLLLLIPFILVSCSGWEIVRENAYWDIEYVYAEYKYEEYPKEDMIANLTWAIKYEMLKQKYSRSVFNPDTMEYETEVYYAWHKAPYFRYRVTFDSGSVWYYYEQPYIQWWAELLLDEENIKNK